MALEIHTPATSGEFDLRKLGVVLWKGKWVVLLFVLLSGLGAYSYLRYADRIYESTATISIDLSSQTALGGLTARQEVSDFATEEALSTEIEVLKSYKLMSRVISDLKLEVTYFEFGTFKKSEHYRSAPFIVEIDTTTFPSAYKERMMYVTFLSEKEVQINVNEGSSEVFRAELNKPFSFHGSPVTVRQNPFLPMVMYNRKYAFLVRDLQSYPNELINNLEVKPGKGLSLINIRLRDQVSVKAADIVNTLCRLYLGDEIRVKQKSAEQTILFIDTLMLSLDKQRAQAEQDLARFELNKGIASYESQKEFEVGRIKEVETRKSELELKEIALNALTGYLNTSLLDVTAKSYKFIPVPVGMLESQLELRLQQLNELLVKRYILLESNKAESPVMMDNARQVNESIELVRFSIETARQALKKQAQYLDQKLNSYRSNVSAYPSIERDLFTYKRNYEIKDKLYSILLERRTETSINKAAIVTKSKVIDSAKVRPQPVSPKADLIQYGSVLAGLLVGILFVTLRELSRTTIVARDELEALTRLPVLGEVIRSQNPVEPGIIEVVAEPRSSMTESFRALRSSLVLLAANRQSMIISVSSSISGEGKSFVSLNLAAALAMLKKKVVLVDLDLRKPSLHLAIGLENNIGVYNALIGESTLEKIVQKTGYQNLDVITVGGLPPNPSEVLAGAEMRAFLQTLRANYDYVVLDTSPVGLVTDPLAVIKQSDAVLFIMRANFSNRKFVKVIERIAEDQSLSNVYLVLNYLRMLDKAYGYGYGYGYGQGYGYYATTRKRTWWERIKAFVQ